MSESKEDIMRAIGRLVMLGEMSPEDYVKTRNRARLEMERYRDAIESAMEVARRTPFPENVRKAMPGDILVDAIIWYKDGDEGPFWQVVEEPLHYGDDFKAYNADDGCKYGLDGAYVEVSDE